MNLEWLESDGQGGFACGTVNGEIRRKWHGWLWIARRPPRDRFRALAGLQEFLHHEATGERHWLSARWENGQWLPPDIDPTFQSHPVPRWEWTLPNGGKLVRTVWMAKNGVPFVGVRYVYTGEPTEHLLITRPILPTPTETLHLSTPVIREVRVQIERIQDDLNEGRLPDELSIVSEEGFDLPSPDDLREDKDLWGEITKELGLYAQNDIDDQIHSRKLLRSVLLEAERDCEDVYTQDLTLGQQIRIRLTPGYPVDLAYSHERLPVGTDLEALARVETARRHDLVVMGLPDDYSHLEKRLALAADRFLVTTREGHWTILAGYPWFTDWGRDAMISIPGLCLATSRMGEAREIIRHFLEYLDDGVIPNLFPEAGDFPMYNTVDATLWLVEMAFRAWTPSEIVADEFIWSALREIIAFHENGTCNHINQQADGLLSAGSPGTQLTWMDVKVNGEVPTPRHGKAVEIQGLWYNAKLLMASAHAAADDKARATELRASAETTQRSFHERFFRLDHPWPADVVDRDAPGDADMTLRPNMIIPFALQHVIYTETHRTAVLEAVAAHLLTPRGLRTLAPAERLYKGAYRGNVLARDRAYHQGTAWMWLLWPYVKGITRQAGTVPELHAALPGLRKQLITHLTAEGCLDHANEIFDGDAPHRSRGCFAQAWSLSALIEILRA